MAELRLYRTRAAYDEVMATGIKRRHEPPRIVGDLLSAEIADTGKRQLAIAIPRASTVTAHGRFYTVVALVNQLESEARSGRQGWLADYLFRLDFHRVVTPDFHPVETRIRG